MFNARSLVLFRLSSHRRASGFGEARGLIWSVSVPLNVKREVGVSLMERLMICYWFTGFDCFMNWSVSLWCRWWSDERMMKAWWRFMNIRSSFYDPQLFSCSKMTGLLEIDCKSHSAVLSPNTGLFSFSERGFCLITRLSNSNLTNLMLMHKWTNVTVFIKMLIKIHLFFVNVCSVLLNDLNGCKIWFLKMH